MDGVVPEPTNSQHSTRVLNRQALLVAKEVTTGAFSKDLLHTRLVSPPLAFKTPIITANANFSTRVTLYCTDCADVVEISLSEEIWAALNNEVLRADEGEMRREWISAGMRGRRKQDIFEKTRQPAASSGTIPTCENPGVTRLGIEPGSPWWEASRITAYLNSKFTFKKTVTGSRWSGGKLDLWSSAGIKGGGGNGSSPRTLATNGIVRHDSHMRKTGEPAGDRTQIAFVGGERVNRSNTAAPIFKESSSGESHCEQRQAALIIMRFKSSYLRGSRGENNYTLRQRARGTADRESKFISRYGNERTGVKYHRQAVWFPDSKNTGLGPRGRRVRRVVAQGGRPLTTNSAQKPGGKNHLHLGFSPPPNHHMILIHPTSTLGKARDHFSSYRDRKMTEKSGSNPRRGRSRIFAYVDGNRAGRCSWSVDFLGDLPFPPPFHSGAASFSPHFTLIGSLDLAVESLPNKSTTIGNEELSLGSSTSSRRRGKMDRRMGFRPPSAAIVISHRHQDGKAVLVVRRLFTIKRSVSQSLIICESLRRPPDKRKKNYVVKLAAEQHFLLPITASAVPYKALRLPAVGECSHDCGVEKQGTRQPTREIEGRIKHRRIERTGETGGPRKNPPTNGIVRHDSHMRKSGVTRMEIKPGGIVRHVSHMRKSGSDPGGYLTHFALVGGKQTNRSAHVAP
ncbi:hypothetical protein PR048_012098 [Dryococelus australis]|uniref:Uncharacterized protein n=1 Tax=Dryococelus australis TaxID=614101 RepID=A0ABQ9HNS2_9NEOP|nr:hypothetical protein PR048_012098 [Dryococelus australis]